MIYKKLLCTLVTITATAAAFAQTDSATTPSAIKTLTLKQYAELQNGPELREMALPATMNGYPLPDDVLQFKKELKLTDLQVKQITEISRYLKQKKVQAGQSMILNEKKLDELFSKHKIDEGSLNFYGNRYGLYQGEYRNAVLSACINTYNALNPQQTTRFWKLKKP